MHMLNVVKQNGRLEPNKQITSNRGYRTSVGSISMV